MDNRASPSVLRSAQILSQLPSIQSDQLSYSLTHPNPSAVVVPTIPRLATPSKAPKFSRRPSTASSAEDKHTLLPPAPPSGDLAPSSASGAMHDSAGISKTWSPKTLDGRRASYEDHTLQEMNRRAHAAVAGLRAEASRLAGVGAFSHPFRPLLSLTDRVCTRLRRPRYPSVAL